MSESRSPSPFSSIWFPLVLMMGLLVLRVLTQHQILTGLPNFTPMLAFAFVGSIVLPKSLPWWSWFFILVGVDMLSLGWNQSVGSEAGLLAYACYALAAWVGSGMRGRTSVIESLIGTLVCSVLFYLVTNSLCWLTDMAYAKNISGWVQALTTGTPGYPTTLSFFRNSLAADLIGAVVLLVTYNAEAIMRHLQTLPLMNSRRVVQPA